MHRLMSGRASRPGRPDRRDGCRNGSGRRLARLEGLLAEALTPLVLVQPAPDPVRLADPKGVVEAGFTDRAPGADGLGLDLAGSLLLALLEVAGREEQGRILAPARSVELPAPGPAGAHPLHHRSLSRFRLPSIGLS